jgi:hypothetical protein
VLLFEPWDGVGESVAVEVSAPMMVQMFTGGPEFSNTSWPVNAFVSSKSV